MKFIKEHFFCVTMFGIYFMYFIVSIVACVYCKNILIVLGILSTIIGGSVLYRIIMYLISDIKGENKGLYEFSELLGDFKDD